MIGRRRAVFLDRDGVINRPIVRDGRPYAPTSIEEFDILPGVFEALEVLAREGLMLVVVTNQPDVGRGRLQRETVEAMHQILLSRLPLDDIRVCYEEDGPTNRYYKPKTGMLLDAARERGIDLSRSYMVGDRWRDVGCGKTAGCFTIHIDWGYAETLRDRPDAVCASLPEAAVLISEHLKADVISGQPKGAR